MSSENIDIDGAYELAERMLEAADRVLIAEKFLPGARARLTMEYEGVSFEVLMMVARPEPDGGPK